MKVEGLINHTYKYTLSGQNPEIVCFTPTSSASQRAVRKLTYVEVLTYYRLLWIFLNMVYFVGPIYKNLN
jgi:hypothetical protein